MSKAMNSSELTKHISALAKEIIDDIELRRISSEAILLKAVRLARLGGSEETQKWLQYELSGYNAQEPLSLKYMGITGRWLNQSKQLGYWGPLAQQESSLQSMQARLQILRIPDINLSLSSANPHESVTGFGGTTASNVTAPVYRIMNESQTLSRTITNISAIKGRVIFLIHNFATGVYYESAFSELSESIFERYQAQVDRLLSERAGDVVKKIPAVYARLKEGDEESINQALNTCRRMIDSFADAIYPPATDKVKVNGEDLNVTKQEVENRINAYIHDKITSVSRRKKLRDTLKNLIDRINAGVHNDVTTQEAESLFLQTYLFLGEVLTLETPPPVPKQEPRNNPDERLAPDSQ